jgi:hypothetical protein
MPHDLIRLLVVATSLALASPVFAQQPLEHALKAQLGDLMFANIVMASQLKALQEENAKLKARLEEVEKKK